MDQGITEESFFEINKSICSACELLVDEEQDKEESTNIHNQLLINTSLLLDDSQGFIQTDNPELMEKFKRLFNAARGYKSHSMSASHNRRLVNKALKDENDDELYNAASDLKIDNAFLRKYIRELTNISKEIDEYKTNKK